MKLSLQELAAILAGANELRPEMFTTRFEFERHFNSLDEGVRNGYLARAKRVAKAYQSLKRS